MMTHFLGKLNGNGEAVNFCKQEATKAVLGLYTNDGNKVTCKACAKKLGIVPAAPKSK